MLTDTDRTLLRHLQADPDLPLPDLAERARVSASTATRRLERLRDQGVILGREARINWPALGYSVQVALRITLDKTAPRAFDDFLAQASTIPELLETQTFLGQVDARLLVIARDMADYQRLYRDRILTLPHITDIEALMTVAIVKDDTSLPL